MDDSNVLNTSGPWYTGKNHFTVAAGWSRAETVWVAAVDTPIVLLAEHGALSNTDYNERGNGN